MLISLLRTYLRPYRRPLAAVVVLQLVGTIASLYLPSLNADIIDNGVATGDTAYILRTGGWMLLVTARARSSARSSRSTSARASRWASAATCAARVFHHVGEFSAREVGKFGAPSLITRTTNDVQQVQMLVLMTCTMLVAAPIMCVGGIVMALREDLGAVVAHARRASRCCWSRSA